MRNKKYLNLGCGSRYHKSWINIDIFPTDKNILSFDITKRIPFPDNYFDVVYHSHLIEHIPEENVDHLIAECYRVLKKDGIIRIATPNLENIARDYLKFLELSDKGDKRAIERYDWVMLELFDQAVRSQIGGNMAIYLKRKHKVDEEFIYSRMGRGARNIREKSKHKTSWFDSFRNKINRFLKLDFRNKFLFIKRLLIQSILIGETKRFYKLGLFRNQGEIHFWMYDRFSLKRLLKKFHFRDIQQKSPFESDVKDWNSFNLDTKNKEVFKPDSIFIEGKK